MSRVDALRDRLPAPLRPLTRGVWAFVWVAVVAFGALWFFGAERFDETLALRESSETQRRLVRAYREASASEDAERERVDALAAWARDEGPGRITATNVQIGVTRLQERLQAIVAGVGDGARALPPDRSGAQIETLIETLPDGRSLHLVRVPLTVQTETMEQMARVIEALETDADLWLRPGNATLTPQRVRDGQSARLVISQVWALVEVRPEGA